MNPIATYTFARLGLLGVVFGIGYIAGFRGVLLYIVSFLGSGILSFIVLNRQRSAMGNRVSGFFTRINDRIDSNTRKEDID